MTKICRYPLYSLTAGEKTTTLTEAAGISKVINYGFLSGTFKFFAPPYTKSAPSNGNASYPPGAIKSLTFVVRSQLQIFEITLNFDYRVDLYQSAATRVVAASMPRHRCIANCHLSSVSIRRIELTSPGDNTGAGITETIFLPTINLGTGTANGSRFTITPGRNFYFSVYFDSAATADCQIRLNGTLLQRNARSTATADYLGTATAGDLQIAATYESGCSSATLDLCNFWVATSETEVSDWKDPLYLYNFIDPDNKLAPIDIAGDGTVGTITPDIYLKGEGDNPLRNSATGNDFVLAGNEAPPVIYNATGRRQVFSEKRAGGLMGYGMGGKTPLPSPYYDYSKFFVFIIGAPPANILFRTDFTGNPRFNVGFSSTIGIFGSAASTSAGWKHLFASSPFQFYHNTGLEGPVYGSLQYKLDTLYATPPPASSPAVYIYTRTQLFSNGSVFTGDDPIKNLVNPVSNAQVPGAAQGFGRLSIGKNIGQTWCHQPFLQYTPSIAFMYDSNKIDEINAVDPSIDFNDIKSMLWRFIDPETRRLRPIGLYGEKILGFPPTSLVNDFLGGSTSTVEAGNTGLDCSGTWDRGFGALYPDLKGVVIGTAPGDWAGCQGGSYVDLDTEIAFDEVILP